MPSGANSFAKEVASALLAKLKSANKKISKISQTLIGTWLLRCLLRRCECRHLGIRLYAGSCTGEDQSRWMFGRAIFSVFLQERDRFLRKVEAALSGGLVSVKRHLPVDISHAHTGSLPSRTQILARSPQGTACGPYRLLH